MPRKTSKRSKRSNKKSNKKSNKRSNKKSNKKSRKPKKSKRVYKTKKPRSNYINIDDYELATSKLKNIVDKSIRRPNIKKVAKQLDIESKRISKKQNIPIRDVQMNLIGKINNMCTK